jgi:hypothetical protein
MVVPDRPEGPPPRRRLTPWSALALAALAVGAVAVLANQTAPDLPETTDPTIVAPAAPTTTTDLLIRGKPIDLLRPLTLDGGRTPLGVAERGGAIYLFTSTGVAPDGMPRGLTLLVSADGVRWEGGFSGLGQEDSVHGVASTAGGFVAYGRSGPYSQLTFWTSADGRRWDPSPVRGPHPGWRPFGFAATERMRLVWGSSGSGSDPWVMLEDALRDRFGDLADGISHYSDSTGNHRIVLSAPLGIPLQQLTLEELGLDPDIFDLPGDWYFEVQASRDDGPWVSMTVPDGASPAHWFTGPDGEIWIMSYDDRGGTRLFSMGPGYVWHDRGTLPPNTGWVEAWRDGLIVMTHYPHDVLISGDGTDWSSTGVSELFDLRHHYDMGRMAVGEGGIAVVAHRQQVTRQSGPPTPPVVELEHSGYLIRVTEAFLSVLRPGTIEVVLRVPLYSDIITPSVSYDPDDRTVTFANQVTGEAYVTLTLDELADMEQELWEQQHPEAFDSRIALITSPDGCNWTSQIVVENGARTGVQDVQSVGPWLVLTVASFDPSWRVSHTEVLVGRHAEPASCPGG